MAKIILKFKDSVLKEIALDKDELTIGRKPSNDIHIDNPAVSGFHARLFKDDEDKFFLEDLNSLNGTTVNGKRIAKVELNNGDDIVIGRHNIIFQKDVVEQTSSVLKKIHSSDETVILDSKVQDEIIRMSSNEGAGAAADKEVVGGFVVIEGSTDKSKYELTDRITSIGKDRNATIKLKGFFTPKIAAIINRKKEGYFINGTNSKKPPQVNGKDITGKYMLKDGDIVVVVKIKLQFYVKD